MDDVILAGVQMLEPPMLTPAWLPELNMADAGPRLVIDVAADDFCLESFFVGFAQMRSYSVPHSDGGEVIVTAILGGGGTSVGNPGNNWDGGVGGGGHDTSYQNGQNEGGMEVPDCEQVEVRVDSPEILSSLTTNQIAGLDRIVQTYNTVVNAVGALPASARFQYADGSFVTAGEMYTLMRLADFRVVASNTDFNQGNATGVSGGAAIRNEGNPIFALRADRIVSFSQSEAHRVWYVLHELAHVTLLGHTRVAPDWTTNQPAMIENEQWANEFALSAAGALNLPQAVGYAIPQFGYNGLQPQYVVPFSGDTRTAAEAFTPCGG